MKVHLDTDLGGDIDDLCAVAMVLRWQGVEITGITTVAEVESKRAGYVRHILALEHREDIPVAAGADVSLAAYRVSQVLLDENAYWGVPIAPSPNSLEQALSLIKHSIEQGAAVVGIGPYTNLYLVEKKYPGILEGARLILMGGYVYSPRPGFPQWGVNRDYNIQVDVPSALYVLEHSNPTLVPLSITVETSLRRAHLGVLREAGALGRLVARQAEAFATDWNNEDAYGKTCANLPDDTINFQHDSLACAIALGWSEGVEIAEIPLKLEVRDGWLYETVDATGKPMRVVTRIDAERFNKFWLEMICGNGQA